LSCRRQAISFDKNRMLVDGVVVDYQQSQQAWIRGPRIQSVAALNDTLELTQTTQLFSKVQSGQSSALVYQWSASGGSLSQAGRSRGVDGSRRAGRYRYHPGCH
jgi:hypothetical protein